MTDYVVKARIEGDASGLKAAVSEAKGAVADLTRSTGSAGPQVSSAPVERLAKAFREVQTAAGAQSAEVQKSAGAQQKAEEASSALGATLKDTVTGLADSGVEALNLGDKLQKVGASAGKFGAILGPVAGALGGVLGLAISGAITGLVSLGASLFESGEASEDAAKSTDMHKWSVEQLTKAIDELDAATKRQMQTSQQADYANFKSAERLMNEARRKRDEARTALQRAKEDLELARRFAGAGDGGLSIVAQKSGEIARLEADLAKLNAATAAAERGYTRSALPILQQQVAEATNKSAKINGDYERTLARLNGQLEKHTITTARYREELEKATKARDAALEVARKEEQQAKRTPRAAAATVAFLNPVDGPIGSGFGPRKAPKAGASTFHRGVDFEVGVGTAVRAPAVGTVEAIGYDKLLGKYVVIDHGAGTKTKFGHLSDTSTVRVGTQLAAGDVFARSGNTGNSTGAHLHYSVIQGGKYVDPRKGRFKVDAGDAVLDTESDIARGESAIAREAKRAAAEAARALEELQRELGATVSAFDPARAAADKYADALERIARLEKAGRLTPDEASEYRRAAAFASMEAEAKAAAAQEAALLSNFSESFQKATDKPLIELGYRSEEVLRAAGIKGAKAFRDEGMAAAEAIARLFGGKIGGAMGDVFSILGGLKSGNFNSVGGPLGSIMTLLGGDRRPGDKPDPFNEGLREFARPIKLGLKEVVTKIGDTFKIGGDFEKTLGHAAGGAALGAVVGPAVTKLLGIRGSKTGATIGGAVGSAAGAASGIPGGEQIGAVVGSIYGSIVGGLFKKAKTGSATITNITGDAVIGGNNAEAKAAAATMGANLQATIANIAEALGGQLGSFSVSLGMKDGNFRLDKSGKGNVKTKKGAIDFGKDQAAAEAAALADAIADGAIIGLSEKVQAALRSTTNIDRALREALKVDELETLLDGIGGTLSKQFRDFDRQAAERVRIAKQYGFDVLKVEKLNAEERVKLTEQILGSRMAPLKDLIASIDFGDLFEGSIADQIAKLKSESAKAKADAEAGLEGAAERFADLERSIIDKTMEGFGTAGPEFAAARQDARSAAERIIELENARVKTQENAIKETNTLLNEGNDQRSEQTTLLRQIKQAIDAIGFGGGGGGSPAGASTRFEAKLSL